MKLKSGNRELVEFIIEENKLHGGQYLTIAFSYYEEKL